MAGFIGFIGLIVPHLVRLAVGADHRNLFPLTALAGGIFLLLSDLVARLSYPLVGTQLPVGVLTSLIGGPLFIALLARSQRREERP
jgi:iron complex transport system permease protein